MKAVLFLGLVGIAIYTALVFTHDLLPSDRSDGLTVWKPNDLDVRLATSWGSDLAALVPSHQPSLPKRTPAVPPGADESAPNQAPGSASPISEDQSTSSTNTAYEPIEWVKVMFAARVHGGASVSSPTLRFYQPGTALQVVGRENGWVKVEDPTSRQSGWVFEQYLASTEDPTLRRTAMATTGGDSLSKPKPVKPTLITKKRNRSSRPAARPPHDVAVAQFDQGDSQWDQHAGRRRGLGLFFFGRAQPAAPYANRAWLVGSE